MHAHAHGGISLPYLCPPQSPKHGDAGLGSPPPTPSCPRLRWELQLRGLGQETPGGFWRESRRESLGLSSEHPEVCVALVLGPGDQLPLRRRKGRLAWETAV